MRLSAPFIVRAIGTSLLMVAVFLSGILSYRLLPVSSLPEVEYPTIQVSTFYPGASPEVMKSSITAPLERQFGQMPGLAQMTSNSSNGSSIITLQFILNLSIDVAEQEVQAAINAATSYLPTNLPNPPVYSKVNPADTPIITLALTSDTLLMEDVEDFAETRLSPKISQLSGVGLVSISGGQRPAVRIQVNPTATSAYGLTLEDVRTLVMASNVNSAKGNFDGPRLAYTINSNDQLFKSKDYQPLIVAYSNNGPVRLSDIANVKDGAENTMQAAWMNTKPAIILNVQRQPGANVIEVADRIKQLLATVRQTLPAGINVTLLTDRTTTIRASVKDVQLELMLSVILVILVIFLFLQNLRATIIPSISVPLSLIGTLGFMYLFNFSLNNLTLMALTIAAGFVVDDAIVMIENISRYIELGDSPHEAALKGSAQIGFTILSLTVSLIAVLIPLLFMGDIMGRLFREFALTLSLTILVSAFISLTLTPMLCARLLHPQNERSVSKFEQRSASVLNYIIDRYDSSLHKVLSHQPLTLLIFVATIIITAILFVFIPKGFFPLQDSGVIQGITEAAPSISFTSMAKHQQALARVVLDDPAVVNISSFIGIDGTNVTLNSGRMLILLKPIGERDSITTVINRLQAKLKAVAGATLYMQPVQDLTIDTRVSRTQYQYTISSPNLEDVTKWTDLLLNKLQVLPQLNDVASDQQNQGLVTDINIDRDTASRLGITMQTIDDTLYDAFGQRQISIIFTQRNQYRVVLEVLPKMQHDEIALKNIYITSSIGGFLASANSAASGSASVSGGISAPGNFATSGGSTVAGGSSATGTASALGGAKPPGTTANGGSVPLHTFASISRRTGPLVLTNQDQFPVATISFNLAPSASLGDALSSIDAAKNGLNMPESVQTSFEGSAKLFKSSLANEGFLLLAAIVVVYIVLGVLYESYIHPLTILSTLPSACMGALLALMLMGKELSVIALIGIILLIGLVMKNAIMMIDFALEQERKYAKKPLEAIIEAALLRFRPIVMTTMASMLGALPLALSAGMGSELRKPLGIVIIGGLIVSQLLTLYSTPVIYLTFDKIAHKLMYNNRWVRKAARD